MQGMPAARRNNQMAVVSAVCAIAGYVIPHPFVSSIIAIYCGHRAKRELRDNNQAEDGDGLATLGLVLGYVHLAMSVIGCVVGMMMFGGMILAFFGLAAAGAAQHGAH